MSLRKGRRQQRQAKGSTRGGSESAAEPAESAAADVSSSFTAAAAVEVTLGRLWAEPPFAVGSDISAAGRRLREELTADGPGAAADGG